MRNLCTEKTGCCILRLLFGLCLVVFVTGFFSDRSNFLSAISENSQFTTLFIQILVASQLILGLHFIFGKRKKHLAEAYVIVMIFLICSSCILGVWKLANIEIIFALLSFILILFPADKAIFPQLLKQEQHNN